LGSTLKAFNPKHTSFIRIEFRQSSTILEIRFPLSEVTTYHPKINMPAAKEKDPPIIGGRRASGIALFPFFSNARM